MEREKINEILQNHEIVINGSYFYWLIGELSRLLDSKMERVLYAENWNDYLRDVGEIGVMRRIMRMLEHPEQFLTEE